MICEKRRVSRWRVIGIFIIGKGVVEFFCEEVIFKQKFECSKNYDDNSDNSVL